MEQANTVQVLVFLLQLVLKLWDQLSQVPQLSDDQFSERLGGLCLGLTV